METLNQIDIAFSKGINGFHNPFTDSLMILVSEKLTWIPLYLVLAIVLYRLLNTKTFLLSVFFIIIGIVLADQISVAMKFGFERLRPCHNESIKHLLHIPSGCGGQFGFVSSHAANTSCIATLAILLGRQKWLSVIFAFYALFNSYSRVYLAKHFVGDVLCGMILGVVIAVALYQFFQLLRSQKQFST